MHNGGQRRHAKRGIDGLLAINTALHDQNQRVRIISKHSNKHMQANSWPNQLHSMQQSQKLLENASKSRR
jgi:hypothetical protein